MSCTNTLVHIHTPTGNTPGMSLSQRVLEFSVGEGPLLELRDEALEVRPG